MEQTRGDGPAPASQARRTVVGLGEILWDLFPQGRKLGGAPANFAFHASALGDRGVAASRVGGDPLGSEIAGRLAGPGAGIALLQTDPDHPTGTVQVRFDESGQPAYTITAEVAWDYLAWDAALERLARETDAVCFGSLAQRAPRARQTIRRFLESVPAKALRVLDINLRPPFYNREVVERSLRLCQVLKLNHEELSAVLDLLGLPPARGEREGCRRLLEGFGLRLVCLTRGARGSLLLAGGAAGAGEEVDHPGFPVRAVDPVGSGDAFTAALVHHLLRGSPLPRIAAAANRYGAWVATQAGAMPVPPREVLEEVLAGAEDGGAADSAGESPSRFAAGAESRPRAAPAPDGAGS